MRLKLYQAPHIGAAMAMIRTALESDAPNLGSRPTERVVEVAAVPLTLARALTRRQGGCAVPIDMPGLDHNAPADRAVAEELIAASCGEPALVLPTGLDPAEASEIADGFNCLGARNLVATRID